MPRPEKKLTDEQLLQVEELASRLNTEQMADYFGVSRRTFFKILKRDKNVSALYKKGRAKAAVLVANNLIKNACESDNMTAAIFYLKTQCGWKEKTEEKPQEEKENKITEIIIRDYDETTDNNK